HFRDFALLDLIRRTRQAVRTSNFLHGFGGNRAHPVGDYEQNHLLGMARPPRFSGFLSGDFHRVSTGTSRANFAARFSMAALIASRLRTSFTTPVLIASAGMPK